MTPWDLLPGRQDRARCQKQTPAEELSSLHAKVVARVAACHDLERTATARGTPKVGSTPDRIRQCVSVCFEDTVRRTVHDSLSAESSNPRQRCFRAVWSVRGRRTALDGRTGAGADEESCGVFVSGDNRKALTCSRTGRVGGDLGAQPPKPVRAASLMAALSTPCSPRTAASEPAFRTTAGTE